MSNMTFCTDRTTGVLIDKTLVCSETSQSGKDFVV